MHPAPSLKNNTEQTAKTSLEGRNIEVLLRAKRHGGMRYAITKPHTRPLFLLNMLSVPHSGHPALTPGSLLYEHHREDRYNNKGNADLVGEGKKNFVQQKIVQLLASAQNTPTHLHAL